MWLNIFGEFIETPISDDILFALNYNRFECFGVYGDKPVYGIRGLVVEILPPKRAKTIKLIYTIYKARQRGFNGQNGEFEAAFNRRC